MICGIPWGKEEKIFCIFVSLLLLKKIENKETLAITCLFVQPARKEVVNVPFPKKVLSVVGIVHCNNIIQQGPEGSAIPKLEKSKRNDVLVEYFQTMVNQMLLRPSETRKWVKSIPCLTVGCL